LFPLNLELLRQLITALLEAGSLLLRALDIPVALLEILLNLLQLLFIDLFLPLKGTSLHAQRVQLRQKRVLAGRVLRKEMLLLFQNASCAHEPVEVGGEVGRKEGRLV